jgi:GGDEF domain-containing protein
VDFDGGRHDVIIQASFREAGGAIVAIVPTPTSGEMMMLASLQAHRDSETNLPDRDGLIAQSERLFSEHDDMVCGCIAIRIRHEAEVDGRIPNDLVRHVSRRAGRQLRGDDLLGRTRPDMLVASVCCQSAPNVEMIAKRLLRALDEPYTQGNATTHPSFVAGMSLLGTGALRVDVQTLCQRAEAAADHVDRVSNPNFDHVWWLPKMAR